MNDSRPLTFQTLIKFIAYAKLEFRAMFDTRTTYRQFKLINFFFHVQFSSRINSIYEHWTRRYAESNVDVLLFSCCLFESSILFGIGKHAGPNEMIKKYIYLLFGKGDMVLSWIVHTEERERERVVRPISRFNSFFICIKFHSFWKILKWNYGRCWGYYRF